MSTALRTPPDVAGHSSQEHHAAGDERTSRRREHLLADVSASIVVALVALPLCLGIAVASGVPAELGLITGIVGGIVAGALPGSSLVVSGPAAGLTVLVFATVAQHGLPMLGPIVLLAGALQILLAALRLGHWFRAISLPVVHGMLAGIGVLIVGSQLFVLVDDRPKGDGIANLAGLPQVLREAVFPGLGDHWWAALIGVLTVAVMLAWKHAPKKVQVLPAPLVAVAAATVVSSTLSLPVKHIGVAANLLDAVRLPSLQALANLASGPVILAAVSFAVIASAESLLSATAVDRMHSGPRTRYNAELLAQGVGNTISGLLGALPMTGVIVRSAANVNAGARTRMSAVLHGVWILAAVAALPSLLNVVPMASLAGVLIVAGAKLVSPQAIRQLAGVSRLDVVIYAGTLVAIVATDLLEGVLVGLVLSLLALLWQHSHLDARVHHDGIGQRLVLELRGAATFLRLPKLAAVLESVPHGGEVRMNVHGLRHVDSASRDLIATWTKQHLARRGQLVVEGAALDQPVPVAS